MSCSRWDGPKLIAVDPYQRLSPALDASIRGGPPGGCTGSCTEARLCGSGATSGGRGQRPGRVTDLEQIIKATEIAFHNGDITQEEAEALAQAVIEKSRQIPPCIEEMALADFAASGLARKGQVEGIGRNRAVGGRQRPGDPRKTDLVVYRASELKELDGVPAEQLRRIHILKKTRECQLIPPEDSEKHQVDPADQLLAPHAFGPGKICWACGKQDWWDKAGRVVCTRCYPRPRK